MRSWVLGVVTALILSLVVQAQEEGLNLTILHTNNVMDAHMPGSDGVGGTARAAHIINQTREEAEYTLLLDGGDRFLNPVRRDVNARIMNVLSYDAMTLGNHEFNGGNEGLVAFLDQLEFPVVAANVDFGGSPILAGRISPSVVLERGGQKIAVIGLANELAPSLSGPGPDLLFLEDEVPIVRGAVALLEAEGVNIIILLAHRSSSDNAVLASTVFGVDVIVGGSDNTLLSNTLPDADSAYPIETESLAGERVLIVQTVEGNRIVGRLNVSFNAEGLIEDWSGDTILLDDTVEPDAEMAAVLDEIAQQAAEFSTVVGQTMYDLQGGDPCREEECTMGNLIADALRNQSEVDLAVYNGGGIRENIAAGDITDEALRTVLPFSNTVSTLELTGADVFAMLEHSVALGGDAEVNGSGRFLQVSGMRFSWDPSRIVGNRILSIEILTDEGEYEPFDMDAIYSLATNDFIRKGGDDYVMLAENAIDPFDFGPPVEDLVGSYIRSVGTVSVQAEGRITRIQDN